MKQWWIWICLFDWFYFFVYNFSWCFIKICFLCTVINNIAWTNRFSRISVGYFSYNILSSLNFNIFIVNYFRCGCYLYMLFSHYAVYLASPLVIPDSIFAFANVSCIINVTVINIFIFSIPLIVCFSNWKWEDNQ